MKNNSMQKGSVMIYTLMILSVLLVISFTIISVNDSQTRNAIATDESVVAFFLAESGAEIMLDRIYSGTYDSGDLNSVYSGCSNGEFANTLSSGTWTASFYDTNGDQLTSCSSTTWRDEADEMKIDGNHSNTIRSIRMSLEPVASTSGGSVPPTYVRSNDDGDNSTTLDIGSADTDRLVAVFGSTESGSGSALTGVTVDGKACNRVEDAYNPDGAGNRTELWYCDEDDLGSSTGTATVTLQGGTVFWAIHVILYTGVSQAGPADSGVNETSTSSSAVPVTGIDVSENGLVLMAASNGGGTGVDAWPSPLEQRTNADPDSGNSYSASGVESSAQTNKTYQLDWISSTGRSSAVTASWDSAE